LKAEKSNSYFLHRVFATCILHKERRQHLELCLRRETPKSDINLIPCKLNHAAQLCIFFRLIRLFFATDSNHPVILMACDTQQVRVKRA